MDLSDIKQLIASGNPKLVLHAIAAWEKDHSHLPEPIIDALKSTDQVVLEAVLKAVSPKHPKVCAPYIASLMHDSSPLLRKLAVQWALPAMGKVVGDSLKQLFASESDVFVLSLAVTAAAHFNIGLEYIESFLEHEDMRVRANAVKSVALLGGDRTRELLEPKLKDPVLRVQNEAIMALAGMIQQSELEKLIVNRLASPDVAIRAATAFIAGELPLAARVDILAKALQDSEAQVVKCAARALCTIEDLAGQRAVAEAFWLLPASALEEDVARSLAATNIRLLLQSAEKAAQNGVSKLELLRKVLFVAQFLNGSYEFVTWINAALETKDTQLRLQALRMVVKAPGNYKVELPQIIDKAERSIVPEEMALGALIKWRSGQLTGFSNLKAMLYSGKQVEVKAAAEVLRYDNGLISHRLLHEAQVAGIIQGPPAQQPGEDFDQPISLPLD